MGAAFSLPALQNTDFVGKKFRLLYPIEFRYRDNGSYVPVRIGCHMFAFHDTTHQRIVLEAGTVLIGHEVYAEFVASIDVGIEHRLHYLFVDDQGRKYELFSVVDQQMEESTRKRTIVPIPVSEGTGEQNFWLEVVGP